MYFTFGYELIGQLNKNNWGPEECKKLYDFWFTRVAMKWQTKMNYYCLNNLQTLNKTPLEELQGASMSTQSFTDYNFTSFLWGGAPLNRQEPYALFIDDSGLLNFLSQTTPITEGDISRIQSEFISEISDYTNKEILIEYTKYKGGK